MLDLLPIHRADLCYTLILLFCQASELKNIFINIKKEAFASLKTALFAINQLSIKALIASTSESSVLYPKSARFT